MDNSDLYYKLEQSAGIDYIKGEIYLTDDPSEILYKDYPHKNEATITCVCMKGEIKGQINLLSVYARSPGLLVLLPDQILQFETISEDFEGVFIIMSKQFIEKISLSEGFSTFISIWSTPYLPISERILGGILDYYRMVKEVLRNTE